jgi:hypothetical protein
MFICTLFSVVTSCDSLNSHKVTLCVVSKVIPAHTIKTSHESGDKATHVHNVGITCRRVFTFRPRLYTRGKSVGTHWTADWVGSRDCLDVSEKEKYPAGNRTLISQCSIQQHGPYTDWTHADPSFLRPTVITSVFLYSWDWSDDLHPAFGNDLYCFCVCTVQLVYCLVVIQIKKKKKICCALLVGITTKKQSVFLA